jgi:hypothetical protein
VSIAIWSWGLVTVVVAVKCRANDRRRVEGVFCDPVLKHRVVIASSERSGDGVGITNLNVQAQGCNCMIQNTGRIAIGIQPECTSTRL